MRIGGTRPHKAQGPLVDMFGDVDLERACDLTAEPVFGHLGRRLDPGPARFERGGHLFNVIPDVGDNPQTCNHDTAHGASLTAFIGV